MSETHELRVDCCIAGGGPAGVMLGYLLARAGLDVVVLEKHADFFRDFRGDTIHPSTIGLLGELGLRERFLELPHNEVRRLDAVVNGYRVHPVNFGRLPAPNDFIALMPQWDFLTFLADEGRALPGFRMLMSTDATGLLREGNRGDGGRIVGVTATGPDGELRIHARLTVAADGRESTLRAASGLEPVEFGVPIDVLWFRMPTPEHVPPPTLINIDRRDMAVTIPRGDYFQVGLLIPKGGLDALREQGMDAFRQRISSVAPFLAPVANTLTDWDQLKLLTVQVNRLPHWQLPGFLCIGDAAHAMSPAFGVGVNYAIQDAVAAANALAGPLLFGSLSERRLARVQRRRERAVARMQSIQLRLHKVIARPGGGSILPDPVPLWFRILARVAAPLLQLITARMIGRGFSPVRLASWLRETPSATGGEKQS